MAKVKFFFFIRSQWPRLKFFLKFFIRSLTQRSRNQKVWYQWKGLETRHTHVKPQSPTTRSSKIMANINVLKGLPNSKNKVRKSNILVSTNRSFTRNIHTEYKRSAPYAVQNISNLRFLRHKKT